MAKARRVWQIAAGDPCRDYSDLFLKHDLMFLGPGGFGPATQDGFLSAAMDGGFSRMKVGQVLRFARKVADGDIVLLRTGYRVKSIGLAHGVSYAPNPIFDDVYGWDLEHTWRVLWQNHLSEALEVVQPKGGLFGGRRQIPTFTEVRDRKVLAPIEHLFERCRTRPLRRQPEGLPPPLTLDEVGTHLFARGLPNEWVDRTIVAIQRQRRIADWYGTLGKQAYRPQEHEVVAHMILPLLLALGWSEQLLAVEWHRIDLSAFSRTPTDEKTCVLVCEAKGLGHGLQDSFKQASRYVETLKLKRCKKILLTDGARLYLYHRGRGGWGSRPTGYINIHKIRTDHVAPAGTNAIDTIVALTPTGVDREVSRS